MNTKRNDQNSTYLPCIKCKKTKPICKFYIRKKVTREGFCKSCFREKCKNYRARQLKKPKTNKHGYSGIVYYASRDLYYARISINGKIKFLGKAATAAEAGQIYQEAVQKYRHAT